MAAGRTRGAGFRTQERLPIGTSIVFQSEGFCMSDTGTTPSPDASDLYGSGPANPAPEQNGQAAGGSTPPAGWYPTLSGHQQYWDGAKWLELPPPPAAAAWSAGVIDPAAALKRRRIVRGALIAGVVVLVVGLIGGGLAWKSAHDSHVAAVAARVAAEKAAAQSRAQQQREEAAAAAAKASQEDAERASRHASVTDIEASVKKMAQKHAAEGTIQGPILSVTCSPVAGGSTDDLTQQTTVFKCFVADKDNGDGTMAGYNYNATMNWSTGSYTYGFGAP